MSDDDRNETDVTEPKRVRPTELFPLLVEDALFVEELISAVRLLLTRPKITGREAHLIGMVLFALERLPSPTKGVEVELSLGDDANNGSSYHSLYIGEESLRLDTGGSVDSGVGHDSYGETVFEAEVGGERSAADLAQLDGWIEGFRSRARDAGAELEIQSYRDESEIDWDGEAQDLWDYLNSDYA